MEPSQISWDDFDKVELRAGTVVEVEEFPGARKPAYKLTINFGELGTKRSSAQITTHYSKEELIGQQVIAVVNFPKKQIANFFSECLVTGLVQADGSIVLARPERLVKDGVRLA